MGIGAIFLAGAVCRLNRLASLLRFIPAFGIESAHDRSAQRPVGRKWMIASGCGFKPRHRHVCGGQKPLRLDNRSVLLGIGTALVYPTLLAAVRMWPIRSGGLRCGGLSTMAGWGIRLGALLSGILADTLGISFAILTIAALTFFLSIIVASVMYETLPARGRQFL